MLVRRPAPPGIRPFLEINGQSKKLRIGIAFNTPLLISGELQLRAQSTSAQISDAINLNIFFVFKTEKVPLPWLKVIEAKPLAP